MVSYSFLPLAPCTPADHHLTTVQICSQMSTKIHKFFPRLHFSLRHSLRSQHWVIYCHQRFKVTVATLAELYSFSCASTFIMKFPDSLKCLAFNSQVLTESKTRPTLQGGLDRCAIIYKFHERTDTISLISRNSQKSTYN